MQSAHTHVSDSPGLGIGNAVEVGERYGDGNEFWVQSLKLKNQYEVTWNLEHEIILGPGTLNLKRVLTRNPEL